MRGVCEMSPLPVTGLSPLETLFEANQHQELSLPATLASLYGPLRLPGPSGKAHVIGNFVTSLDGVVALSLSDQTGGGEISGYNTQDQMVMGILRSIADVIIVGAGTLRAAPLHMWTPDAICHSLGEVYSELRRQLGKAPEPLNVFVTARGSIDLDLPVFSSGKVPVLIVTTTEGERLLRRRDLPPSVRMVAAGSGDSLGARAVLEAVRGVQSADVVLTEGGPRLMADFFADNCLDELFLTLAPQVAGRNSGDERPGLVAGREFLPDHPRWGRLASLKRGGSHLFLRYAFTPGP
jgi:riboflavin biosynthesis pyrimidine reductase